MSNNPAILVFDLETTVQRDGRIIDNSPFNPKNKIVSIHWLVIEDGKVGPVQYCILNHNDQANPDSLQPFIADSIRCNLGVAHNAKFDWLYCLEANIPLPSKVWCTMIGEYIFDRAQGKSKSLKNTAERRDVHRKKSDLVDDLFKGGTGFEEMPLETVIEYANADVISCAEIFIDQKLDLAQESNAGLKPVFDLMNEMLLFLVEIERNGIKIDLEVLNAVEAEYLAEKNAIEAELNSIIEEVMGDTPINLNSGADMSKVVYSRYIPDRDYHCSVFNIGSYPSGRKKMPPKMTAGQFSNAVRKSSRVMKKTIAHQCDSCGGTGKIQKVKVDGQPYKNESKCPKCIGNGFIFELTGKTAGLKLSPEKPGDASVNGFKVDKQTINRLLAQAEKKENEQAINFLSKFTRLQAISTYLDSFIKNIQFWTRPDGFLHASFNQCMTKTGRLSSSNPNFQNQPKGNKFPVRKCVVSRFDNVILEADFSGLEFRVAGELSKDKQIIDDISNGKDVHKQTAAIINQCDVSSVTKEMRQAAKAYTFSPLYGGMGANEPDHIKRYFEEYFAIYKGLKVWHKSLMDGVMQTNIVRTPSGREFYWENPRRMGNGRISNATQVVNYPVQSFATADIVVLSCIRALRGFREQKLKSKLIITVHDSIVVDVFPGEEQTVKKTLASAMREMADEIKKRFNYNMIMPLDIEMTSGKNWMEQVDINID
jgi:DNA polymerase I-like protein with 3'-5' exonuclease and polymerase domains